MGGKTDEFIRRKDALDEISDPFLNVLTPEERVERIQMIPVADVKEVISCKDCVYYGTDNLYCPFVRRPKEDDFCSRGKEIRQDEKIH